jgi:hypothetical protein
VPLERGGFKHPLRDERVSAELQKVLENREINDVTDLYAAWRARFERPAEEFTQGNDPVWRAIGKRFVVLIYAAS